MNQIIMQGVCVYEITSSENNLAQLDDAEFQALYLEVIQAIWDLINPVTVESEVAKLYAAESKTIC